MADNKKFLDYDGLLYYHGKVKDKLDDKVDKVEGKGLSTNDYTTAEKNKLKDIAEGANKYELPIASATVLGGIKVGTGLSIDADTGVLNATGEEVTIDTALNAESTNPVQNKAIATAVNNKVDKVTGKGLSTNDYTTDEKNKLKDIAAGAEVNQNAFSAITNGTKTINAGSKTATLTVNATGAANVTLDGTTMTISATNTEYNDVTTSTHGLMTAADKTKLDGIEEGANKTEIDSALSATSENPVQNKTINTALGNKVDKVSGKGLSTNDYTTTEKNKLSGIEAGAQVNIIESIKVNGTAQTITNKAIDITVPTDNNELTNGAGYQTESDVTSAINEALKDITGIDFQILTDGQYDPDTKVPTVEGKKGIIYLVPKITSETNNTYIEWIYSGSTFEKIGDTSVDLSNYWNTTNLTTISNGEIDTIIATK